MSRPTEILIDLNALVHNCTVARDAAPCSKIVAAIKADAYGHGSTEVARTLSEHVDMFALSCMEEASALRKAGISTPLLLLEGCFSADEYTLCEELQVEIVIHQTQQLELLARMKLARPLRVWLKVDTGMHRLGIAPEHVQQCYQRLQQLEQVKDVVLTTHLACADELNSSFTLSQLQCFDKLKASLVSTHRRPLPISIANSAGILAWRDSHGDFNRPGIMLYGLSPFTQPHQAANTLRPVMTFQSKVIAVRNIAAGEKVGYGSTWTACQPSTIATVAVGYGDGYPRTAKNGTPVLVGSRRVPLVGRVSMDMITVDVTALGEVSVGTEVQLWGPDLNANEVAACAGTSGYELVTRMPTRTPKRYISVRSS